VVYVVHLDGTEKPVADDDVKAVKRIPIDDIEKYEYFADHKTILLDYRRRRSSMKRGGRGGIDLKDADASLASTGHDFVPDVVRSIC